ncbi:ATP-binding cassette domain-containing protein [Pedobacter sp. LMG 31464]|uniref:ATP-binding cassette domain-containing protein n=1 Tax=Pedobacter planticolens TaxID=2679964 RepID=A0A923E020_9SPHI|nr:ABC transporter ATP-binding protein [Pedobacter planticolens]MBB2146230.1 ATP-binding cassette domain-containing protein [Pedobacter planticolens]
MEISLNNVGRRFNKEWIFKNINYIFKQGEKYAILGPNGSGKSTLLSVLLGNLTPSEGEITYTDPDEIRVENIYQSISFAAPYLDLVEEFTLQETIDFHFQFKAYADGLNASSVLSLLGLEKSQDKALKHFSSGMKQRTKLALACCANTSVLILDEPTSNLDTQGIDWYLALIEKFATNKMIIVGSNQAHEYDFCKHQLSITDYK